MIGRWVGNQRCQDERTWVGTAYHAGKSQRRRRAPYKNQLEIWRKGLMSLQVFSSFCQLSSILVFVSSSPCKMKDHQLRPILLNLGPFNHLEAYDLRLNTGSRRVIFRIPDMLCFFSTPICQIKEDQRGSILKRKPLGLLSSSRASASSDFRIYHCCHPDPLLFNQKGSIKNEGPQLLGYIDLSQWI